ncbi:replication initiation factor [mine drainage metagenome]|uniref:Replication initiation factor n=1 Tax=mine drainage metagenome TaxID=410659 RepID=A0A1J5RHP2_9ZZZZ
MSKNQHSEVKPLTEIQGSAIDTPAREAADGSSDELGLDTAPTNRVSNKYNTEYFQPLRWGIDSLYLSYSGSLHSDQEAKLDKLKKLAQADQLSDQAVAQLQVNDHIFEVKDKGTGMFPFIIEDNCFRIQLSRQRAKSMPMAYVKISSEYLTHKSVKEVVDDLSAVLYVLGDVQSQPKVSRIDLFVDFASNENMESWHRDAWVTRSEKINQYAVKGEFSGWSIGMGSTMAARLYNKTLEILTSKKQYLEPLWKQAGWDGIKPIWRLEFEFKRDILVQFDVQAFNTALANLNGLWNYATTEWLKLTIPSEGDTNRSRWAIHPLWAYLASIDFETSGGVLSREFTAQRVPSDSRIFDYGFSAISSFMAREGITDLFDGVEAYYRGLCNHLNNRAANGGASFEGFVDERVAIKAKRFNSILNKQAAEDELTSEEYRKHSDGE